MVTVTENVQEAHKHISIFWLLRKTEETWCPPLQASANTVMKSCDTHVKACVHSGVNRGTGGHRVFLVRTCQPDGQWSGTSLVCAGEIDIGLRLM